MAAFTAEGLARLDRLMRRQVERERMPGLVALVSRGGETHVKAFGELSFGGADVRPDSIFRIASMTKLVTAAAAMMLVEDGVLRLDQPIDDMLPELAGRKVLRTLESEIGDVVEARRQVTLRDLLTFRCGDGAIMAMPGTYPIQRALEAADLGTGPTPIDVPGDEFLRRLSALPLVFQPGEAFLYDTGSDILSVLIARSSGQSFGGFLQDRIFGPLGMVDTGFHVPQAKMERFATQYESDHETGGLKVWDEPHGMFAAPPPFESGGGGLVSTAGDFLKFAEALLGEGKREGVRLLSAASVRLMTTNHLTAEQRVKHGADIFFEGHSGWGFGMAVCLSRTQVWTSPGRFGWDGGFGTSCYIDPATGLIGILLTQRMMDSPSPPDAWIDFWTAAYAALD